MSRGPRSLPLKLKKNQTSTNRPWPALKVPVSMFRRSREAVHRLPGRVAENMCRPCEVALRQAGTDRSGTEDGIADGTMAGTVEETEILDVESGTLEDGIEILDPGMAEVVETLPVEETGRGISVVEVIAIPVEVIEIPVVVTEMERRIIGELAVVVVVLEVLIIGDEGRSREKMEVREVRSVETRWRNIPTVEPRLF